MTTKSTPSPSTLTVFGHSWGPTMWLDLHLSLRLLEFLPPESDKASRAHPRPEAAAQRSGGVPPYTPDRSAQPGGDQV